jgi:hypothetical protein
MADSPDGIGVSGYGTAGTGGATGVYGRSDSPSGWGVAGWSKGICVEGYAMTPGAMPFRAVGASGQTAPLQEWQNYAGTPLAVVDKDGQLGIGTSTPLTPLHIKSSSSNPAIRIENENNHVGQFIYCYSDGNIPFFSGRRARGNMGSPSAVQANDVLMRYGGSGYGATTFPGGNRAILEFRAAEAWTDSAQGTYIYFSTTPTGSTATAERMRITADGNLGINNLSPSAKLDVAGSTGYNQVRMRSAYTPTGTADSNGNTGDLAWDDSFVYIKTSVGWKRSALSTF